MLVTACLQSKSFMFFGFYYVWIGKEVVKAETEAGIKNQKILRKRAGQDRTGIWNIPRLCLIKYKMFHIRVQFAIELFLGYFWFLVPASVSVSAASLTTPTWNGKKIVKKLQEKYKLYIQLNKYETDPYFLQIFQSNTSVCLIISVFCKSCEPICEPEITPVLYHLENQNKNNFTFSVQFTNFLQNAEINIVLHWKFWRKYGSVCCKEHQKIYFAICVVKNQIRLFKEFGYIVTR